MSCIFFPSISMSASWFAKRRGFAIGIVLGGSSIGGVIWPILSNHLLLSLGFPWMCRITGFIVLGICSCSTMVLKLRVKPKEGMSMWPDFHHLKKPAFTALLLANMSGYFGLFGVIFFLESRAASLAINPALQPYMLSILNAASLPGRIIPGLLADRFGPINTWLFANAASTIFIFAAWVPSNNQAGLVATAILYGISSGAWVSVLPACIPRVAGPENVASSLGLLYFLSWPGALSGASLGALMIHPNSPNSEPGYRKAGYFWGAWALLGTVFVIICRLLKNRKLLAKE